MVTADTFPTNFYEQIEFDQVRELAASFAFSVEVRNQILALEPKTEVDVIRLEVCLVDEYRRAKIEDHALPMARYESVEDCYDLLRIEGYILEFEHIVEIGNHLSLAHTLDQWRHTSRSNDYKKLLALTDSLPDFRAELKAYQKVFDPNGEVRSDASPKLIKITEEIDSFHRKMNGVFERVARSLKQQGLLDDSQESFRNGRRVLSVLAEHKRQIKGIIHGESGGGRIYFIEPQEMVQLNNQLFDLENEKRKEVYRILGALCGVFRDRVDDLRILYALLLNLDHVRARGELALLMDAERPVIADGPSIKLVEVRHPLLLLKNKESGDRVIPFDLNLHGKNQLLLISGPNAGGKSITLKAFALAQVMVQSGLLPTCDENSEFGVYHSFFSDIGDQQSIDASLSTYSSRLTTLKKILDQADHRSLVFIDEFGSGTDPQLGAALAEAVLRDLVKMGVWGVITTHYSNLKLYAYKTRGLVNGGMLFDEETLQPTYQLRIGKPGNSYAFEVAEKIGLSKSVLAYARKKSGSDLLTLEKMISSLERQQKTAEDKSQELESKQRQLDGLIGSYEALKRDLDIKKKKFRIQQKEANFNYEEKLKKEVAELAKKAQKTTAADLEKKKEEIKERQRTIIKETQEMEESIQELEGRADFMESLKIGDNVKIIKNGLTGKVVALEKNKVLVETGNMTLHVKSKDLRPSGEALDVRKNRSVQEFVKNRGRVFVPKLDIRGFPLKEAEQTLQDFLDEAILSNSYRLEILHGKGTGALRKMVHNKLKEYKDLGDITHPADDRGGTGITIVEL